VLELKKIGMDYDNTDIVLKDVNYKFKNTGFYFILGKSGSGKSTLLSIIAGLLSPTSGKVINQDKKEMSLVFQDSNLISKMNVIDNSCLYTTLRGKSKKERYDECNKILKVVNIESLKNKNADELSGGEKQRVALVRALLSKDSIILADEPTGALDESNALKVMDLLKEASRDRTVICVTHNEKLANEYGDVILELKEGKLFEIKSNNSIVETCIKKDKTINKKLKFSDSLKIVFDLIKEKLGRIIFSTVVCGFSFALLSYSLSISDTGEKFSDLITQNYLNKNVFRISKKEVIQQSNGINLEKNIELNNLYKNAIKKEFKSEFYYSYNFFLPSAFEYNHNNEIVEVYLEPYFSNDKSNFNSNYLEVIGNYSFLKAFNLNDANYLNYSLELPVKKNVEILYGRTSSYDYFEYTWKFKVVNNIEENETFNYPTLYYNYFQLENILSNLYLDGDSGYSVSEVVKKDEYEATDIRSYETIIVCNEYQDFIDWALKRKKSLKLSSKYLTTYEACKLITDSISKISTILTFAVLIIVFFIEFFCMFTINEDLKKNYALIKAFCPNNKTFTKVFFSNDLLFFSFSLISYISFIPCFKFILPKIMNLIGIPGEIISISLLPIIISLVILFATLTLSTTISFIKLRKANLSNILRCEKW